MSKFTTASFIKSKQEGHIISMLTAYDYSTAKLLDEAGVDSILVGDSLGMVVLGYENTLQVTVDDIIHHAKAVSRGAKKALVIADMPFLSYHISIEDTIKNAGRMIQEANAHAVKLEGGKEVIDKVTALVKAQIPVVGHLGLTPQSVNMMGGFKVQGKEEGQAREIIEDAKLLQEAGAFAIVLECVPEELAKIITENLEIPTIGIGAGKYCDGQVLVTQDMLGMFSDFTPKFVKKYCDIGGNIKEAVALFCEEIQKGSFPEKKHTFSIDAEIIKKLY
ncbi:3-methyl-2-oxobutanoate hydroxymethyltransferase [Alkaliphilus peptidifermentans]|uniref:3-methyl-2-oxobutanoate hydroxymethyltransferase n=1 Tax=Alkaliphilus peptidifermentans DSM 18978 TaxID=1120976 RepID=A0A1G5HS11_9FIRM|nr:3-methyl-2-oxobutanoate hydroxymethyltransferase [Alkaliphilus peptidifermentans]SCY66533.1 ketopantoate hydroxymethyltransferase [Alkaliphilus peptidifermentans DSM 18978]